MVEKVLVINAHDNVAVALLDIESGDRVVLPGGEDLLTVSDIPFGHKVALVDIDRGEAVFKYGEVIGRAACPIAAGEWVHAHNLEAPEAVR